MAGQSVFTIPIDIVTIKPIAIRTYRPTGDRRSSKNFQKKKFFKCFENIPPNVSQPVMMLVASVFKTCTKKSVFAIAATVIFFHSELKKNGILRITIAIRKILLHDM